MPGGSVNYQSKWTQSNTASYSQEGYVLVGLYVGYDIVPGVTVSANLDNLFDKTYFTSISSTSRSGLLGAISIHRQRTNLSQIVREARCSLVMAMRFAESRLRR